MAFLKWYRDHLSELNRITLVNQAGSGGDTSVVQDRQGYLWFATEDGLNRYKDQEINVFRHVPGDSTSLSSNSVSRMLVDRRGRKDFTWYAFEPLRASLPKRPFCKDRE